MQNFPRFSGHFLDQLFRSQEIWVTASGRVLRCDNRKSGIRRKYGPHFGWESEASGYGGYICWIMLVCLKDLAQSHTAWCDISLLPRIPGWILDGAFESMLKAIANSGKGERHQDESSCSEKSRRMTLETYEYIWNNMKHMFFFAIWWPQKPQKQVFVFFLQLEASLNSSPRSIGPF